MILADTSVWIDQLRAGVPELNEHLRANNIVMHPWVIGEVALGNLAHRERTLGILRTLPTAPIVDAELTVDLISSQALHGLGIGYVDLQLIASVLEVTGLTLWTRDRRLLAAATRLGIAHVPVASAELPDR